MLLSIYWSAEQNSCNLTTFNPLRLVRLSWPSKDITPLSNVVQRAVTDEKEIFATEPEEKQPVNLQSLAEDLLPLVKRLLAIEIERSGGSFR